MDLTERYIHAVMRHLPANQRAGVADELRATIADKAAGHAAGKKPGAKAIEAALQELGRPETLAKRYTRTKRYLIGPQWFDMYAQLLKQLLLYIPALVALIVFVVSFFESGKPIDALVDAASGGIGTAIQIAFWTTLGFIIAERSGARPKDLRHSLEAKAAWRPKDLPELPGARQISVADTVTGIALMIVSATFLVIGFQANPWSDTGIALLNADIWSPWGIGALVLIGLTIIHELYKLRIGNWTYGLAASNIVLNTIAALFITYLFTTQDVLNPLFLTDIQDPSAAAELERIVRGGMGVAVIVTIVISIWSSIDGVRKALSHKHF